MALGNVEVQFVYLPKDPLNKWGTVPEVHKLAADWFFPATRGRLPFQKRRAEGGKNVAILEAPDLAGLNVPHFEEELHRTGRFLEGYMQHAQTGFFKAARFAPPVLRAMRKQIELAAEEPPIGEEADEKEGMFLLRSMLMFDKLHRTHPFSACIEPRSGKQNIDAVKQLLRDTSAIRKELQQKDAAEESDNLDDLIADVAPMYQASLQTEGRYLRERYNAYCQFILNVVNELSGAEPTRVLIPRNHFAVRINQEQLEREFVTLGANLRTPCRFTAEQPSWRDNLTLKHLNDPNRTPTREEILVLKVSHFMLDSYTGREFIIGTEDTVFNTWSAVPPPELEAFSRDVLSLKNPKDQHIKLLNFYGSRRGQGLLNLGMGDIFVGRALDPVFEKVRSALQHRLEPDQPEEPAAPDNT